MDKHRKCPHCGSTKTSRSHRKGMERLLLWFKPFRCAECLHRFYAFDPRRQGN